MSFRLLHFGGRPGFFPLGSNGSAPPTARRSGRTASSPLRWTRGLRNMVIFLVEEPSTGDLVPFRSSTRRDLPERPVTTYQTRPSNHHAPRRAEPTHGNVNRAPFEGTRACTSRYS